MKLYKCQFCSGLTSPHSKMNSDVSDKCWHGCGMTGTLVHLLWHCPEINAFWLKVRDYLCTLFKINFPLCPVVGLLGNKIDQVTSKELQHLLDLAFLSVKQIIIINWKGRKLTCFKIDNWQWSHMLIESNHITLE